LDIPGRPSFHVGNENANELSEDRQIIRKGMGAIVAKSKAIRYIELCEERATQYDHPNYIFWVMWIGEITTFLFVQLQVANFLVLPKFQRCNILVTTKGRRVIGARYVAHSILAKRTHKGTGKVLPYGSRVKVLEDSTARVSVWPGYHMGE
jgi:hypothetical protein